MTENILINNKKSMKIPKDVIRIRKSKQDIYCHCQKDKDKDKKTNKDLQILHRKLKIEEYNPNKTESELRCSGKVSCSRPTSATRCVIPFITPVIAHA